MFKAVCPLASQMLVHADGRNYASALITLDPEALAQWGRARGLTATDYPSLAGNPAVHRYVRAGVEELNGRPTAGRPSRTSGSSTTTCRSKRTS